MIENRRFILLSPCLNSFLVKLDTYQQSQNLYLYVSSHTSLHYGVFNEKCLFQKNSKRKIISEQHKHFTASFKNLNLLLK